MWARLFSWFHLLPRTTLNFTVKLIRRTVFFMLGLSSSVLRQAWLGHSALQLGLSLNPDTLWWFGSPQARLLLTELHVSRCFLPLICPDWATRKMFTHTNTTRCLHAGVISLCCNDVRRREWYRHCFRISSQGFVLDWL